MLVVHMHSDDDDVHVRRGLYVLWWSAPLLSIPLLFHFQQGFDHLQSLLINPATYPTGKVSKTAILEKC